MGNVAAHVVGRYQHAFRAAAAHILEDALHGFAVAAQAVLHVGVHGIVQTEVDENQIGPGEKHVARKAAVSAGGVVAGHAGVDHRGLREGEHAPQLMRDQRRVGAAGFARGVDLAGFVDKDLEAAVRHAVAQKAQHDGALAAEGIVAIAKAFHDIHARSFLSSSARSS